MASYLETKVLIGRILGIRDFKEDDDFTIDLNNWRYSRHRFSEESDLPKQFVITDADMKTVYNTVSAKQADGLELYSATGYEIAIDFDPYMSRQQDISLIHEDTANKLLYELGKPTIEYCFHLLISFLDANESFKTRYRNPPMRYMRPVDPSALKDDQGNVSLETILQAIVGEVTLKISTSNGNSRLLTQFRKYKTAFLFEFMYKSNIATIEYGSVDDIFYRPASTRERPDISQMDAPQLVNIPQM